MEAKKTAKVPKIIVAISDEPEAKIAPTRVMPEIALAPDIRGVCSVEGTLVINSTPKKIERTKTKIKRTIWVSIYIFLLLSN
tara:strand:- start:88489 stop:88734 length:246 start_codon:yes stop_codon:yes gene_type:complete